MAKVRMRSPDDGKVYEFEGKHAIEARKNGWEPVLGVGQQVAKTVADVLPAVGGGLGTAAGFGGGAIATTPAAGVGGIPGAVVGGTAGSLMGAAGREALYGLAGIPKDDSPLSVAGRLAGEGAYGMLGAGMQAAPMRMAQAAPGGAVGVMKQAVGNAQPGVQNTLLREGLTVDAAGMAQRKALTSGLRSLKARLLNQAEEAGTGWSWKHLREVLNSGVREAQQSDVVSPASEEAMKRAVKFLSGKLGPKVVGGGESVLADWTGKANIVKEGVKVPATKLTPTRLERIRVWADARVKSYEQARRSPDGTLTGVPSPDEDAYRLIGNGARRLLNTLPGNDEYKTLGDVNARLSSLSDAGAALYAANKRSRAAHAWAVASGLGLPVATGAVFHNPALALSSLPAGLVAHAATDPAALSRLALVMNNPGLMARLGLGAGVATRLPELGARLLGVGAPPPPQEPQP